jgi:hypothetical protein
MGKHFIDPKSREILSIFQVFPCTTQIALFWPKLLTALFLKKPRYPGPFEILEETLRFEEKWFYLILCPTCFGSQWVKSKSDILHQIDRNLKSVAD